MIPVAEARAACLALVRPLPAETVPLIAARGRVLAAPVVARHDQPPFATATMDGYALGPGGPSFRVVGEAPAGRPWDGKLGPDEAIRIFTGAAVPGGATRVAIQEDVTRKGDRIEVPDGADPGPHIRAPGADFARGDRIAAPCRLTPARIALAAAMGHAGVTVARRPDVAILATGDELAAPGDDPGPGGIVASNHLGLHAMAEAAGARASLLPIARDDRASLAACLALGADADLIVTIGGASVGDHDLVRSVDAEAGMEQAFYKVAMRPGKPLMAGRMGTAAVLGLPGNPVSSMVCGRIFMVPMIEAFQGLPVDEPPRQRAPLAAPLAANGPREHYMRARRDGGRLLPADSQDSALLTRLAFADALIVRPPHDPARAEGEEVEFLPISD